MKFGLEGGASWRPTVTLTAASHLSAGPTWRGRRAAHSSLRGTSNDSILGLTKTRRPPRSERTADGLDASDKCLHKVVPMPCRRRGCATSEEGNEWSFDLIGQGNQGSDGRLGGGLQVGWPCWFGSVGSRGRGSIHQVLGTELDGVVYSAPIQPTQVLLLSFDGKGEVLGDLTESDAQRLALAINVGALPLPLKPLQLENVQSLGGSHYERGGRGCHRRGNASVQLTKIAITWWPVSLPSSFLNQFPELPLLTPAHTELTSELIVFINLLKAVA